MVIIDADEGAVFSCSWAKTEAAARNKRGPALRSNQADQIALIHNQDGEDHPERESRFAHEEWVRRSMGAKDGLRLLRRNACSLAFHQGRTCLSRTIQERWRLMRVKRDLNVWPPGPASWLIRQKTRRSSMMTLEITLRYRHRPITTTDPGGCLALCRFV